MPCMRVTEPVAVSCSQANALGPSSSHTRNDPDLQADLEILSALLVGPAQPELQKKLNDLPPDSEVCAYAMVILE